MTTLTMERGHEEAYYALTAILRKMIGKFGFVSNAMYSMLHVSIPQMLDSVD